MGVRKRVLRSVRRVASPGFLSRSPWSCMFVCPLFVFDEELVRGSFEKGVNSCAS